MEETKEEREEDESCRPYNIACLISHLEYPVHLPNRRVGRLPLYTVPSECVYLLSFMRFVPHYQFFSFLFTSFPSLSSVCTVHLASGVEAVFCSRHYTESLIFLSFSFPFQNRPSCLCWRNSVTRRNSTVAAMNVGEQRRLTQEALQQLYSFSLGFSGAPVGVLLISPQVNRTDLLHCVDRY